MLERVLVAVDGSTTADGALAFALRLGHLFGSELVVCTAVDRAAAVAAASVPDGLYPSSALVLEEYDAAAKAMLSDAAARATAAGTRVSTALLDGRPAGAIVACARERAADAIVIGTRGKRDLEHAFLGSTAEGVLRISDVPVFVIRDGIANGALDGALDRILVAVDDSDASRAAVSLALEFAVAAKGRLLYCNVVETADVLDKAETFGYDYAPVLEELHATSESVVKARTRAARERGVEVDSVIVEGSPANALLEAASTHAATLIAVGTHGRRGLRRLFLGSVAENVVRRSALPVLVVRAST